MAELNYFLWTIHSFILFNNDIPPLKCFINFLSIHLLLLYWNEKANKIELENGKFRKMIISRICSMYMNIKFSDAIRSSSLQLNIKVLWYFSLNVLNKYRKMFWYCVECNLFKFSSISPNEWIIWSTAEGWLHEMKMMCLYI